MTRQNWRARKKAEREQLERMRAAEPITHCTAEEARQATDDYRDQLRWRIQNEPDHQDVPIWESLLEHGCWTAGATRRAIQRGLDNRTDRPAPPARPAQGELF